MTTIRDGYFSVKGAESIWKEHIKALIDGSPMAHALFAIAAGSMMRDICPVPSAVIYLKNASTTGKTVMIKLLMSLRSNPQDIMWCFDSVSTLDYFVKEAHELYLCLDDAQHAIIPDKSEHSRHISDHFLQKVLQNDDIQTTLFLTSLYPSHLKNKAFYQFKDHDLFPIPKQGSPWWMDEHLVYLYQNYGFGTVAINNFELEYKDQLLALESEGILKLLDMGNLWIKEYFYQGKLPKNNRQSYELFQK